MLALKKNNFGWMRFKGNCQQQQTYEQMKRRWVFKLRVYFQIRLPIIVPGLTQSAFGVYVSKHVIDSFFRPIESLPAGKAQCTGSYGVFVWETCSKYTCANKTLKGWIRWIWKYTTWAEQLYSWVPNFSERISRWKNVASVTVEL